MSILVNIKQNPKNLKKIGLKFIKKIAAAENLCFGVLNEACSFDEYEGGEDIRNQLLILFSRKSYGRGMSLTIDDNYNLELVLNFPATQTDINNFYKIIKNICKKLKTETFLQEETKYKVDKIEELREEAIIGNQDFIKNIIKEETTIFGCMYPITIEEEFITKIKTLSKEQAVQYFESYLHEKQKEDYYYAKPMIYQKENGKCFAKYVLTEGVPSIFPLKYYLPFRYNQNLLNDIEEWSVAIVENNNNNLELAADIPFEDFYKLLDVKNFAKFDATHIIITVDKELLQKLKNS